MPIDFSQVKTITIPEGSVKKITDSTGNILWKENIVGWHTVWEGSKKIGYGGTESKFVFATEHYSNALKIRVSFSDIIAYVTGNDEGSITYTPSNKVSPVTYNSFSSNLITLVKAEAYNSSRRSDYTANLYYNKNNGEIYGDIVKYGTDGYARSYIVITKIEVYS